MALIKKLTKIGNSYGVILPPEMLREIKVKKDNKIQLKLIAGAIQIEAVGGRENQIIETAKKYLTKYSEDFKKMAQ